LPRATARDNLRVADTSIYPDNVQHNTNLTALVVGEKAAAFVIAALAERRGH
jgi:choline dehydrogenase-like flavoprotein